MTAPLAGPQFGTYSQRDVQWLLKDLSHINLEDDNALRERRIQAGIAHYAESLPHEYQPDARYRALFMTILQSTAARLARAVGTVTELVLAERGIDIVLASLARAGTPIAILMRRWAEHMHRLELPHYSLSIVRGRGIDTAALNYLAQHHDPATVVFVDGWTGKGAITAELRAALIAHQKVTGTAFSADLAVLADPGYCVRTYGTRDDFLIASACLNSTVSGLVSRTVLHPQLIGPHDFHGAKYYHDLIGDDVSNLFLDTVCAHFGAELPQVSAAVSTVAAQPRDPTWTGWQAVEKIRRAYALPTANLVKPGVGETTRVLLRRLPWRILVRDPQSAEHLHIRILAETRGVPIEVVPDLPYACVGLIKDTNAP